MSLPVHIIHGRQGGPVLFISAAVHGDELNGVEIIRRLLKVSGSQAAARHPDRRPGRQCLRPSSAARRYLPDRRDLNRSFPGSSRGSLASQLADLFMKEVVARAAPMGSTCIRAPSIAPTFRRHGRTCRNGELKRMASAFGAPLMIDASHRDGSLRAAATSQDVPTIVYEAGEALRFDEFGLRVGPARRAQNHARARHAREGQDGRVEGKAGAGAIELLGARARRRRSPIAHPARVENSASRKNSETIADPFGDLEIPVVASDGGIPHRPDQSAGGQSGGTVLFSHRSGRRSGSRRKRLSSSFAKTSMTMMSVSSVPTYNLARALKSAGRRGCSTGMTEITIVKWRQT